jgi:hypothetical protein
MNPTLLRERFSDASPRFKARIAGTFYLITFLSGMLALVSDNGKVIANVLASIAYVVVTILFYDLFKPVNKTLSLIAAGFSLIGCALGILNSFSILPIEINSLVFFGFYCLLIGYLIIKSTFLPRILGVLMMFGGLGWLTFLSTALAKYLIPFNTFPGILGEGALTLWLLVAGVNEQQWREQAGETILNEAIS